MKNKGRIPWNKGLTRETNISVRKGADALRGRIFSEKHKEKLSQNHADLSGTKHPMYRKHHSKEARKRMSIAHKGTLCGEKNPAKRLEVKEKISKARIGMHFSEETKKRISEGHKGQTSWMKGKRHTEEAKRKLSLSHKGKTTWMKGKTGKLAPGWKGGLSFLPYCYKFNNELKEKIRGRDNRTCQLCGLKENGQRLSVHHIHYDKPNCDPDLITLCRSCNCKVNENRDYWEVYFMRNLKERSIIL